MNELEAYNMCKILLSNFKFSVEKKDGDEYELTICGKYKNSVLYAHGKSFKETFKSVLTQIKESNKNMTDLLTDLNLDIEKILNGE